METLEAGWLINETNYLFPSCAKGGGAGRGVAGDPFSWGFAPFSGGGGIRSGRELQEKGRVSTRGTRVHRDA